MSRKEMIERINYTFFKDKDRPIEDLQKHFKYLKDHNKFHLKWKVFEQEYLYNAEHWAICGGIALHKMNMKADVFFNDKTSAQTKHAFNGKKFGHLFGPTPETLIKEAKKIRCKAEWIQKGDPPHIDVVSTPYQLALEKCLEE